jgi:hypothetical protein
MAPGESPFIIRRQILATIVKGLKEIQFDVLPNRWLKISGITDFGGRHVSKLFCQSAASQSQTKTRYGRNQAAVEILAWAEDQRNSKKKTVRNGTSVVGLNRDERKRLKADVKVRKIDAEITRLEKKIAVISSSRPVNPLLAKGKSGSWRREYFARLNAERSIRRSISRLAARHARHHEERQVRKAVTITEQATLFDIPVKKTAYETVTESVRKPFAWKQFYADLEKRGIHVRNTYDRARGRNGGPSGPSAYCRSMRWFGLADRTAVRVDAETSIQTLLATHANERMSFLAGQREIRSLQLTIASLRELRASIEAELAQDAAADEEPAYALAA